ncbi:hypothetical protein [Phytobacter diazotrophicus]
MLALADNPHVSQKPQAVFTEIGRFIDETGLVQLDPPVGILLGEVVVVLP